MENMLNYIGQIVAKPRMTQRDKWKHRPVVDKYHAFKDNIRIQARQQRFQLSDNFAIHFDLPMPSSWSEKKKKEMEGQPHRQKPDLDNLIKGVVDTLLPDDDSAVHSFSAHKTWVREGSQGVYIMNKEGVI